MVCRSAAHPPITKKKIPPAPSEKNLCPELRDPHAGEFAFAPEGEAISSCDPKNGNRGNSGSIVPITPMSAGRLTPLCLGKRTGVCRFWSAQDTHDCYPRWHEGKRLLVSSHSPVGVVFTDMRIKKKSRFWVCCRNWLIAGKGKMPYIFVLFITGVDKGLWLARLQKGALDGA